MKIAKYSVITGKTTTKMKKIKTQHDKTEARVSMNAKK